MVKTDESAFKLIYAFPNVEEREFLFEMVEPALQEGKLTLQVHQEEALTDVEDIEAFTNNMGRQNRRMDFLQKLYNALERSLPGE